ncbi:hypothetical protein EUX98_g4775 [Antrodiella citrinella]|uniref:Zn(2)-C6 fungal-type domain-containing protein n=1 Tax=Antrodiella citrinella TaxID=2447956 RepID=A0A4S4N128_9APHY|nr:hypothetical protein EUX98_g4775 [Antrodiella citrinella]
MPLITNPDFEKFREPETALIRSAARIATAIKAEPDRRSEGHESWELRFKQEMQSAAAVQHGLPEAKIHHILLAAALTYKDKVWDRTIYTSYFGSIEQSKWCSHGLVYTTFPPGEIELAKKWWAQGTGVPPAHPQASGFIQPKAAPALKPTVSVPSNTSQPAKKPATHDAVRAKKSNTATTSQPAHTIDPSASMVVQYPDIHDKSPITPADRLGLPEGYISTRLMCSGCRASQLTCEFNPLAGLTCSRCKMLKSQCTFTPRIGDIDGKRVSGPTAVRWMYHFLKTQFQLEREGLPLATTPPILPAGGAYTIRTGKTAPTSLHSASGARSSARKRPSSNTTVEVPPGAKKVPSQPEKTSDYDDFMSDRDANGHSKNGVSPNEYTLPRSSTQAAGTREAKTGSVARNYSKPQPPSSGTQATKRPADQVHPDANPGGPERKRRKTNTQKGKGPATEFDPSSRPVLNIQDSPPLSSPARDNGGVFWSERLHDPANITPHSKYSAILARPEVPSDQLPNASVAGPSTDDTSGLPTIPELHTDFRPFPAMTINIQRALSTGNEASTQGRLQELERQHQEQRAQDAIALEQLRSAKAHLEQELVEMTRRNNVLQMQLQELACAHEAKCAEDAAAWQAELMTSQAPAAADRSRTAMAHNITPDMSQARLENRRQRQVKTDSSHLENHCHTEV